MSIFELLFGLRGRINRMQWWMGTLGVLSVAATVFMLWNTWLADYALPSEPTQGAQIRLMSSMLIVATLVASVLVWMFLALAIKRIHDHERPGLWALAYALPPLLTLVAPNIITQALAALTLAWALIDLGLLPGTGPRHLPQDDNIDDFDVDDHDSGHDVITIRSQPAEAVAANDTADIEVGEWPGVDRASTFGRRA